MGDDRKPIKVKRGTHARLLKLAGKLQKKDGKRVTVDQAISHLFKKARIK